VHCLVTLAEGKSARRPAWWVTLKVLVCDGESSRRKYMEHAVDPGREYHKALVSRMGMGREKYHIMIFFFFPVFLFEFPHEKG
jgi:hypothetical protein